MKKTVSESKPLDRFKKYINCFCMNNTTAIVFAAGKGSRMMPLTETTPKPLAKIKNQTLLEINLKNLSCLADSYILVVAHLKEKIQAYLGEKFLNKPVYYATQENPKGGTLDALRTGLKIAQKLNLKSQGYVVSGSDDVLQKIIYDQLLKAVSKDSKRAYLMAKKIEDRELLKSKGVFRVNQQNEFIEIVEKPQKFISNLTNIGLYYLPENIAGFIPPKSPAKNSEKEEYITDLFNQYSKKKPIQILPTDGYYHSISSLEDLKLANQTVFETF